MYFLAFHCRSLAFKLLNTFTYFQRKSLILPPSLLSSSELDIQALSKTPFGTQHYKNKGTFQYPSKLSAIFNEYPLFKSLHFVAHLQRNCKQGHMKSGSVPANAHDLTEGCLRLMARRIAYNMCYLKKTACLLP